MDIYFKVIKMIEDEMGKIKKTKANISERCATLKIERVALGFNREMVQQHLDNLINILSELKNKKNYLSFHRKIFLIAAILSVPVCLLGFALVKLLISGVFTLNTFHILSTCVVCSCLSFIKYRSKTKDKRYIYKNYNMKDVEKEISLLTNNKDHYDKILDLLQRLINEYNIEMTQLEKEYENKLQERDEYIAKREVFISKHIKDGDLINDELCLDGWLDKPERDNEEPCDEKAVVPRLKHS